MSCIRDRQAQQRGRNGPTDLTQVERVELSPREEDVATCKEVREGIVLGNDKWCFYVKDISVQPVPLAAVMLLVPK